MSQTLETLKSFVLDEFLPGEDPSELTPTTPLQTSGILDSIATLKLVTFIEERFEVRIEPHEMSGDSLNTLENIERLIAGKGQGTA